VVEKGRAAVYSGLGHPFEIKEYPVPDPEPGAILIKVSRADICGSDLHMWRGDIDLAALGAPLPAIIGHEMTGTVAKLGEGVTTDSAGQPLAVGGPGGSPLFLPLRALPGMPEGKRRRLPYCPPYLY